MENKDLIHTPTPQNFIYPEIKASDYKFGSGKLTGVPLRENGDWRDYTPPEELQNKNGVESSACFIEAQQHAIATILEEQFLVVDENYSSRFNLIHSESTPSGGSPIIGANSIRHYGLIPDSLLPFSNEIKSWEEFNSFKGGNELDCMKAGQMWLEKWSPYHDIVFEKLETIENKFNKLKAAIKYSPICASVVAWYQDPKTGLYVKPKGMNDTHLVEIVHVEEDNSSWIFDTYPPFLKHLEPNYNFDFGLRWTIEKTVPKKTNWLTELIINFLKIFKW